MSKAHKITFTDPSQVQGQLSQIGAQIYQVCQKEPVEIVVQRSNLKSRDQESKYHAMIGDIRKTAPIETSHSFEAWKALLIDEFVTELARNGESLSNPGETILSFDKKRLITIRPKSSNFLRIEAAKFITFLYSFGHEIGARFSDPSIEYYEEAKEIVESGKCR